MTDECVRCGEKATTSTIGSHKLDTEDDFLLCELCSTELDEFYHIVAKGGVLWRCSNCGMDGVIKPSEYTDAVRTRLGIEAPDPCGVEFSKCSEHNVEH